MAIYNLPPGGEMHFSKRTIDAFFSNPTTWEFPNPMEYTRDGLLKIERVTKIYSERIRGE